MNIRFNNFICFHDFFALKLAGCIVYFFNKKNKILEDENKELLEQLMGSNVGNKPSRIFLLIFGITFALGVLGSTKLITLSTASIYNRKIVPRSS